MDKSIYAWEVILLHAGIIQNSTLFISYGDPDKIAEEARSYYLNSIKYLAMIEGGGEDDHEWLEKKIGQAMNTGSFGYGDHEYVLHQPTQIRIY